jgi:hypothetical protein
MDVEDLLADPLIGVFGCPEQREPETRDEERRRREREEGGAVIP